MKCACSQVIRDDDWMGIMGHYRCAAKAWGQRDERFRRAYENLKGSATPKPIRVLNAGQNPKAFNTVSPRQAW